MPPVLFNAYCTFATSKPLSLQRILRNSAGALDSWLAPHTSDAVFFGPNGFLDSEIRLKIRVRILS